MSTDESTITTEPPSAPIITDLPHALQVRAWHPNDMASCAHHANNFKVWLNMTDLYPHPYTMESAQNWIKICADKSKWMRDELTPDAPLIQPNYVILHDGECIGSIGLKPRKDIERRSCEIGYWIGEKHWGKGYMPILLRAFVEWTWRTFPALVRLDAEVFSWNPQSGKALKKAGFELEGIKKKSVYKDGKITDKEVWVLFRDVV